MSALNYYQILGVSSSASDKEIRKAYHRLIKRFHPDHSPACKDAAKITSLLNEAYMLVAARRSQKRQCCPPFFAGWAELSPAAGFSESGLTHYP